MFPVRAFLAWHPGFPRSVPVSPVPRRQPTIEVRPLPAAAPPRSLIFVRLPRSRPPLRLVFVRLHPVSEKRQCFRPGSLFSRRPDLPVCSHVDVTAPPRFPGDPSRPLPCFSTPAEPTIPRLLTVSSMLPPRFPRRRLQRLMNFGAQSRAASAPAAYASRVMLPPPMQSSLPAGWLAFAGRASNPSLPLQKVSDHYSRPPFFFPIHLVYKAE